MIFMKVCKCKDRKFKPIWDVTGLICQDCELRIVTTGEEGEE